MRRGRRVLGAALLAALALWAAVAAGAGRQGRADADPERPSAAHSAPPPAPAAGAETSQSVGAPATAPLPAADAAAESATPAAAQGGDDARGDAPSLPTCEIADLPTRATEPDGFAHAVLDTAYALPADYVPADLVELHAALGDVSRYAAAEGQRLRRAAAADLHALFVAAEAAGVRLEVASAYRSYEYQRRTFGRWVEEDGYEHAVRTSARAGHSEHQLGTVVDLKSRGGPAAWDLDDWAATPEGAWLAENAWRFGFVMSYPRGKEAVTCYLYEPWHYRYLGRELAARVRASGLAPREYLWVLADGAHDE